MIRLHRWAIRSLITRGVLYLTCFLYSTLCLMPIIWLVIMSISTNKDIVAHGFRIPYPPRFSNWLDIFVQGNFIIYFVNTLMIVFPALLGIVLIGAMGGYAIARFVFPGRELLYLIFFSFIILPQQVLLIPLFIMFTNYHLQNTRLGLILIYITISLPLTIYILRNFFEQIPEDLADAARLDGCSEWMLFWKIMFPIAVPAVASITILNFIFLWNEFLLANIFIRQESMRTIQLGLMQYFGRYYLDYAHLAAASFISILPILAIYLPLSNLIIKSVAAGALRG